MSPVSSSTPRVPSSTLLRHRTRTWMTLRSASYSLKYTENTPITAVRKVCLSVRRQCLSRHIERGNLWKRVTSINFVLVSETRTQERIAEERESSHAQIRTMLDEQRRSIIAECSEKVLHHEFLAAQAEQERKILQEELWRQQQEFREVHQQDLTEMEESRKFQSSTFDTLTRQKL